MPHSFLQKEVDDITASIPLVLGFGRSENAVVQ